MKISTRTRYGLRFLIFLGLKNSLDFVQLKEVAKTENISLKYLEQIAAVLKSAKLILSRKGQDGGYQLALDPVKISVLDIVLALQESLDLVECQNVKYKCSLRQDCVSKDVWFGLNKKIKEYLSSINLADLVSKKKTLVNRSMYYI